MNVENKPLKEIFEEKGKPIFEKMGQRIAEAVNNEALKIIYDQMHSQGSSAWFCDGQEERGVIIQVGEPWGQKRVLEIGCGEGELVWMIYNEGAAITGLDYSRKAILKAKQNFPCNYRYEDYKDHIGVYDRIVMQGILEHLDDPFTELKWMIDNLLVPGGDVITSSPCFLNPRGIVWMTLDMLGAVMSKTDLHFLHPWQFDNFCKSNNYKIAQVDCNYSWAGSERMIEDLTQRIPLALQDGNIPFRNEKLILFLHFLKQYTQEQEYKGPGATMIYRIKT